MKIYKSVWHADLWAANNCKQEDINSFFEVFNKLAPRLFGLENANYPPLETKSKFLVRTQVDGVPLLRLKYLGLCEPFMPCNPREETYAKIINAIPLVITPQDIDYMFFPGTSSQ